MSDDHLVSASLDGDIRVWNTDAMTQGCALTISRRYIKVWTFSDSHCTCTQCILYYTLSIIQCTCTCTCVHCSIQMYVYMYMYVI